MGDVLNITLTDNKLSNSITNWRVSHLASFSDHGWILYDLNLELGKNQPFRNPKRIDWNVFSKVFCSKLRSIPNSSFNSVAELETQVTSFEKSMRTAFNASCPKRYSHKTFPPWWNEELSILRKKTRAIFNICHRHKFYQPYKDCLRIYKRAIASSKRQSWQDYCHSVENIKDSARLSKVLSKEHCNPSFLKKPDGLWTVSPAESLDLLMQTHFPGCKDEQSELPRMIHSQTIPSEDINSLIAKDNIAWAINSFAPYKSPGPDGIIPIMLQKQLDTILPLLEYIFKGCLLLNHVPSSWKQVKVVFIPKVGRRGHESAKDFRPISLTSFVLKTLERILDMHIRANLSHQPLSNAQHAYMKGKSTETALHEVVRTIENSLNYKEYTLATFLDIEGAFNNVRTESILESLNALGIEGYVSNWIISMLKDRNILAKLGNKISSKYTSRGTPQGGVLSPLLWLIVMNTLLIKLESSGVKVVAYADDLVLLVAGKFLPIISELTEAALRKVSSWATNCGLGVNESKTELMLFTKKTKIPTFNLPQLNRQTLSLSSSAKYLGVILDTKLNWKINIEERVKKASIAFYACNRTFGKKWGLKSKTILWTYTAVVRPILTYGSIVWWPALSKTYNINRLRKLQRSACVGISGALRSCPTDALNVMLDLLPLDLQIKYQVGCSALRLKESGCWTTKPFGHSNISLLLPMEMFEISTDYCNSTLDICKGFKVRFPSRSDWDNDNVARDFDTLIYTDGSKMDCGVGAGIFSESLKIAKSIRLPNHASVFQAELLAIREACMIIKNNPHQNLNIAICTDSQAAIKAINSAKTSSKLVQQCRIELNNLSVNLEVTVVWIPGHSGFEGNEHADELARLGSALHDSLAERVCIPLGVVKGKIHSIFSLEANQRWSRLSNCATSRAIWPRYNKSRTKEMLCRPRKDIAKVVATCTGHWPIGEHAAKLGIPHNNFCRSCANPQEKETVLHFLCLCPALARTRSKCLGKEFFSNLNELSNLSIRDLIAFINSANWF